MKPLPRAASGTVVSLDADLYNFLADNLERMDKWIVKPPLNLQQTPAGNLLSMSPIGGDELALVMIIGIETGGGRYQGSILSGNSTGSTSNNFQLQATLTNLYTDGPVATGGGDPVNNALVINMLEPYVSGSHLLYNPDSYYYAYGKVMGKTSESTPRTIVYLQNWPVMPVVAQITGAHSETYGGVYRGEIVRGQFPNQNSAWNTPFTSEAPAGITGTENCWITNIWEQVYMPTSGGNALAVGTFVMGIMCGFPAGAQPGGTLTDDTWYMVYTMTPARSAAVTINTLTGVTSTDLNNLYVELNALYNNLRAAGYSL
jgi:hypothetical protein